MIAIPLTLVPAIVLLTIAVVMAFSGRPAAGVEVRGEQVVVTLLGPMVLLGLRRHLRVDLTRIHTVHADHYVRNTMGGLRVAGTHLPRLISAGWFYRGGRRGWEFLAVYRAKDALVLDLTPEGRMRRVIVEVDDLESTAAAIQNALAPAG